MEKNSKRSFTLIEILVTSTIIVVLTGVSIAIFTSYKEDRLLINQVSLFVRALELAKSKATANDTSQCADSTNAYVNGYEIQVNPTAIQIYPNCDTIPSPIIQYIDPQVAFVTPTFSLSFGSQNYTGATTCIPLKNKDNTLCKFIKIDETGLITQGNCSSCSPLACPCP